MAGDTPDWQPSVPVSYQPVLGNGKYLSGNATAANGTEAQILSYVVPAGKTLFIQAAGFGCQLTSVVYDTIMELFDNASRIASLGGTGGHFGSFDTPLVVASGHTFTANIGYGGTAVNANLIGTVIGWQN